MASLWKEKTRWLQKVPLSKAQRSRRAARSVERLGGLPWIASRHHPGVRLDNLPHPLPPTAPWGCRARPHPGARER